MFNNKIFRNNTLNSPDRNSCPYRFSFSSPTPSQKDIKEFVASEIETTWSTKIQSLVKQRHFLESMQLDNSHIA